MANAKTQSSNGINTMTNVKNQIPCLPKAVNLTFGMVFQKTTFPTVF